MVQGRMDRRRAGGRGGREAGWRRWAAGGRAAHSSSRVSSMVAQSEAFPAATASHSWTCRGATICLPVLAPENSGSAQHAPGSSSTSAASASPACSVAENSPAAAILASRRYSGRRRMRPADDPRVLATASCLATSLTSASAASSFVSVGSAGCPLPSRPTVCSTRRLGLSRAAAEALP